MSVVIISNDTPTARVAHRCEVCGGTVAPGDRYVRQRGVYEGDPYTWKGHALCAAAHFQCRRDLDLYPEEAPEPEEVLPYVLRFFANVASLTDAYRKDTDG